MKAGGLSVFWPRAGKKPVRGFTLIEVMIASGILFMCLFAILAVLSNCLRNARALQHRTVDIGMAASELYTHYANTNRVAEEWGTGDFGETYPDYSYDWHIWEFWTNGWWQVDVAMHNRAAGQAEDSQLSFFVFNRQ